MAKSKTG